jgi:hypothetical protein
LPATGIISGATSANPIVGPTINTVYTVTVTDANGCTATDQVNVNFTPFTPTTISYAGAPFCTNITTSQLPTFTGITGGTYSASPSGLSINTSTGAIVPSTSTAGTYTITYTVAGSGICPAISVIQTVVINNLPATPTVTPAFPCAGVPLNFTAGNGALYEFTINGISQGIPSSTNTFTSPVLVTGDEVCVISYPPPPFSFEGNITEPEWGIPIAKSTGGPATSGFGPGNNLDALCKYFDIDNSKRTLHGALLDAELLAEVYMAMTRGQDSLLMDLSYTQQQEVQHVGSNTERNLKVLKASELELVAHNEYIHSLAKAGAKDW